MAPPNAVRELALGAIASATRSTREEVAARASAADLDLDSLTLLSVVSLIEAACELEFRDEDILRLLQAHDLAALLLAVEDIAARARAGSAP